MEEQKVSLRNRITDRDRFSYKTAAVSQNNKWRFFPSLFKDKNKINALFIYEYGRVPQSQIFPFHHYKNLLSKKYGFSFDELCGEILNSENDFRKLKIDFSKYDIIFIHSRWSYPPHCLCQEENVQKYMKYFMESFHNFKGKIITLDNYDSTGRCDFSIIPIIDLYIKKQFLSDFDLYHNSYVGGNIFFDYFIKNHEAIIPDYNNQKYKNEYRKKLCLGWNLGTCHSLIKELYEQEYFNNQRDRKIDIHCRCEMWKDEIVNTWRSKSIDIITKMDNYNVVSTGEKIHFKKYMTELYNSKICVSSFGWGEICFRDFEAIICGSLLIKQDMGHVQTEPNIYIPYETYVPIKWDLSDLADKCKYYLNNNEERRRITKKATEAYKKYFEEEVFIDKIKNIFLKLGMI